jgi:ComF family protein
MASYEYIVATMLLRLLNPAFRLPKLASQCAICRSWPAQPVCDACVARFVQPLQRCCTCALRLPADLLSPGAGSSARQCGACIRQAPPLDTCLAAVDYAYPWSTLISDYKFGQDAAWAAIFAQLLLQAPGVSGLLAGLDQRDCLLPMPLARERLQTRGFNQAWELVKVLARQSATPARANSQLLLRIKNTAPQSRLTRQARLKNIRGAFVADPLLAPALRGRQVVLVDDVMTSGASLFGAAQALQDAGAAKVSAIVFARTA